MGSKRFVRDDDAETRNTQYIRRKLLPRKAMVTHLPLRVAIIERTSNIAEAFWTRAAVVRRDIDVTHEENCEQNGGINKTCCGFAHVRVFAPRRQECTPSSRFRCMTEARSNYDFFYLIFQSNICLRFNNKCANVWNIYINTIFNYKKIFNSTSSYVYQSIH